MIYMEEKKEYVIILINGKKQIWPYPEAQEFCLYDLSGSIIFLTDNEYSQLSRQLSVSQ